MSTGICFLAGRGMVPQGLFYHFPDRDTANCILIFFLLPSLPFPSPRAFLAACEILWAACFSIIKILSTFVE